MGKSAYCLLAADRWQDAGSGCAPGERVIDEAWAQGFNTLRVFVMAWWPRSLLDAEFVPAQPRVNPWSCQPGSAADWWRYEMLAGGDLDHLPLLLDYIERQDYSMVVEICVLDAMTLAAVALQPPEHHPQEAARFLYNPYWPDRAGRQDSYHNEGPPAAGGRESAALSFILDKLSSVLAGRDNVYIEIGNQVFDCWWRDSPARPALMAPIDPPNDAQFNTSPYPNPAPFDDFRDWSASIAQYLAGAPSAAGLRGCPLTESSVSAPVFNRLPNFDSYWEEMIAQPWNQIITVQSQRSAAWYLNSREMLLTRQAVWDSGKPFVDDEPNKYCAGEGECTPAGRYTAFWEARNHAWITFLSGGYVTYHSEPSARTLTDAETEAQGFDELALTYACHFARFFGQPLRPGWAHLPHGWQPPEYWRFLPEERHPRAAAGSRIVVPEDDAGGLFQGFVAVRDDDQDLLCYILDYRNVLTAMDHASVLLDNLVSGCYSVTCFDPADGTFVDLGAAVSCQGQLVVDLPHWERRVGPQRGEADDWVLRLQRTGPLPQLTLCLTEQPGGECWRERRFSSGGRAVLTAGIAYDGAPEQALLYVVLDAYGHFFFYPGWTEQIAAAVLWLDQPQVTVFDFRWPRAAPAAPPVTVWAGLTRTNSSALLSNLDSVSLSYSP